jgi:two-component system KDP operon response regulator KdpE
MNLGPGTSGSSFYQNGRAFESPAPGRPLLVLAVDDEVGILRLLKLQLEQQNFTVLTANNEKAALKVLGEQRPDIILLDVLLAETNGLDLIRTLRETTDVPIILVSGKDSDGDKVAGLDGGADDYIVKPFTSKEIAARIRAVLRRRLGFANTQRMVQAGDLAINLSQRFVDQKGARVALTRTEWLLLEQLAANVGKVMLNSELLSSVWGPEYRDDLQYLRVWVSRLRGKLEADPRDPKLLLTAPGIGYRLDGQVVAATG